MNIALEKAFIEARNRPDDEQEFIAAIISEELADEMRWQANFARDAAKLGEIAKRVRGEVARGEALPYDPSNMPE